MQDLKHVTATIHKDEQVPRYGILLEDRLGFQRYKIFYETSLTAKNPIVESTQMKLLRMVRLFREASSRVREVMRRKTSFYWTLHH